MAMTRIKICGITTPEDALAAAEAGAHAIGLVFAESPRRVDSLQARHIIDALPPFVSTVGVFMNAPLEEVQQTAAALDLDTIQLHGQEPPAYCSELAPRRIIKRFNVHENDTPRALAQRMEPYRVAAYLLDPGAGSGRTFDWSLTGELPQPLIVSGGLNPDNVGEAVRLTRPFAVDVASGVETAPGRKSPLLMRAFVQVVKEADDEID